MSDGAWIITIGIMVASACSLLGCFLVLRRLAMLSDAISHSVLPGIVIAFLLTGSRSAPAMLIGAGSLGLLTAYMTALLARHGRLQEDAAIGVTFTWLFALGVILVSRFAGQVDLDLDCVLYGEITAAPFDVWSPGGLGLAAPRAFWITGGMAAANTLLVVLCYKQLKICAFDPALAASLGINAALWHYLLMGFVSVTTVASFESVGAILVIAMLIVPPNAAYLLTDRLSVMLPLSVAIGAASAVGGYFLARSMDGSISGAMAVTCGASFALALIFSPRHGLPAYLRRRAAPIEPPAET